MNFARENEFMVSAQSYFEGVPSRYAIRSVQQSVLVYILTHELMEITDRFPEFNVHLNLIAGKHMSEFEYHAGLLMLSRKDRFEKVVTDHPWMKKGEIISDKMLAGYLGITPNCLCGFRRRM